MLYHKRISSATGANRSRRRVRGGALCQAAVERARKLIDAAGRDIRLEVDGGIKVQNIQRVAAAGADTFVAGSAIFGRPDYKAVISAMRIELSRVSPASRVA